MKNNSNEPVATPKISVGFFGNQNSVSAEALTADEAWRDAPLQRTSGAAGKQRHRGPASPAPDDTPAGTAGSGLALPHLHPR